MQIRLAMATPRKEAESRGLYFGRLDIEAEHPDYLTQEVLRHQTRDSVTLSLTHTSQVIRLTILVEDESENWIRDATATIELVKDPPYPAGPQKVAMPASLIFGTDETLLRGVAEAPGYKAMEFELVLEPGSHQHRLRLEKED